MNAMKKRGLAPVNKPCNLACAPASAPLGFIDVKQWVITETITEEQEKTAMNTDTRTEAQQAKDYLFKSLQSASWDKDNEIAKAFNINSRAIETLGELRAAVKGSWFSVSEAYKDYGDNYQVYYPWDFLEITNPERKIDRDGYHAAQKELKKAESDVKDTIVVHGPEKGLEALNLFKVRNFSESK